MEIDSLLRLWGDRVLREYIRDLAAACSHAPSVQADLMATAWLAVDGCECGVSTEHAMDVAGETMVRRYRNEHIVSVRRWHETPERKRVYRKRKRYFVVVSHPPRLV